MLIGARAARLPGERLEIDNHGRQRQLETKVADIATDLRQAKAK